MTQIGAFRLLLHDGAMHGSPLSPPDAHAVLVDLISDKRHVLLSCPTLSREFVARQADIELALTITSYR
jgi:hypothetical protein